MLEVSINNLADAMNRLAYAIEGLNPQSAVAVTQAAVLKAAVVATETAAATTEPEAAVEPADKKPARKTKAKSEPVAEPAAVEPEPAAEPEPTPEPTPEPAKAAAAAVSAVSKDQLRVVFGQLSKAKGGNAVKAILNDFGFEGFSTVPDDAEEIEAMYRTAQEQLA